MRLLRCAIVAVIALGVSGYANAAKNTSGQKRQTTLGTPGAVAVTATPDTKKSNPSLVVTTTPSVSPEGDSADAPVSHQRALPAVGAELPADLQPEPILEPETTAPNAFEIPWQVISAGGEPSTSTNYEANSTSGQTATGAASSTNYEVGMGYWYGATAGTTPGCVCDCHADPKCDAVTNVLDVVLAVNVAFRGAPSIIDPNPSCPRETTDADCSGFTNVLDVVRFVNVAFRGQPAAANFCDACP